MSVDDHQQDLHTVDQSICFYFIFNHLAQFFKSPCVKKKSDRNRDNGEARVGDPMLWISRILKNSISLN